MDIETGKSRRHNWVSHTDLNGWISHSVEDTNGWVTDVDGVHGGDTTEQETTKRN